MELVEYEWTQKETFGYQNASLGYLGGRGIEVVGRIGTGGYLELSRQNKQALQNQDVETRKILESIRSRKRERIDPERKTS